MKALYRAFKQECPSGISDEETFKEVYQKIFPLGDSSKYAGLVFKSIDQNKTGAVTFGQFLDFLSLLSKGSVEEKILWTFTFYDVNKDGFISRDEMLKVIFETFLIPFNLLHVKTALFSQRFLHNLHILN